MCNAKTCIRCNNVKGIDSFTRIRYRNGCVHEKRILDTCLQCLEEAKQRVQTIKEERQSAPLQTCAYCGKTHDAKRKVKYCSRDCGRFATGQLKKWDNSERKCVQCETPYTPKSEKQACCSKECRYNLTRANHTPKHTEEKPCVICGTGYIPLFAKHQTCSQLCSDALKRKREHERIGTAICTVCSKEWQPNAPVDPKYGRLNKYCSTECRSQSEEWQECQTNRERATGSQWLTYGTEYQPFYSVSFNNCRACNRLFTTRIASTVLCSEECREEDYKRGLEQARIAAYEKAKAEYVPKEITCKCCGKQHTTEYGATRQAFCSDKCSKKYSRRVHKATRRARMRGNEYESIDPFKVFARDKWSCRICGVKTPRKLRGTFEDNAPELDHIIPLAKGGPHIYENVQCACRKCNQSKSDKIIGQVPMFLYSQIA
jgi:hypothetical protein